MAATYLIDGYNLAHALGLIRKTPAPGELHVARRRLLALLEEHRAALSGQVTVVFDAKRKSRRAPAEETSGSIQVIYAVGREADDLIEESIVQQRGAAGLVVVSDDHRIQKAARRGGGQSLGNQAFLNLLEAPGKGRPKPSAPDDKPADLSEDELAAWLETFRDVKLPKELRDAFEDS